MAGLVDECLAAPLSDYIRRFLAIQRLTPAVAFAPHLNAARNCGLQRGAKFFDLRRPPP
jgi:hypothetical protein